jgi:hypothetical protein
MDASGRCAQVDVGLDLRNTTMQSTSGTLVVQSTGAPDHNASRAGVVWYCIDPVRMPLVS